jgi:hypothetical protein
VGWSVACTRRLSLESNQPFLLQPKGIRCSLQLTFPHKYTHLNIIINFSFFFLYIYFVFENYVVFCFSIHTIASYEIYDFKLLFFKQDICIEENITQQDKIHQTISHDISKLKANFTHYLCSKFGTILLRAV